jgi:hypothetical protein
MPIRFQVDGDFYDHPKTTNMSDAAFSLWVRAGSFSAAKLTDGFISDDVLVYTLRSSTDVADELVRRRLWKRVRGGYRFHEWEHRNLTKTRVDTERKADRDRKARARGQGTHSAGSNGKQQVDTAFVRPESDQNPDGIQTESDWIPPVSLSVSLSGSVSGSGRDAPEPPTRCPDHIGTTKPPPCGPCADARKTHEAWEAHRRMRLANSPKCPSHRGQLAHNCAQCAGEAKAAGLREAS